MSVLHPLCREHAANARRRRVSHRAPALRPHRTDQISMRVQRAHNREEIFRPFRTPPNLGGGWPSPGFAVLHFVRVWQAKRAVANMKVAEEAAQVRSHTELNVLALRESDTYLYVDWRQPFIRA